MQLMDIVEQNGFSTKLEFLDALESSHAGVCLECGEITNHLPADTKYVECEHCGVFKVMGTIELEAQIMKGD